MAKSDHKRHSAKHKIDRRLGVNLWGRPKSPLNSREYGPGQHGQRRKKPTDFGVQLMAKQKLKGYYGNIGEKQFKKYYQKATRLKGDTGQNLVGILETRLDAVLYRSKMVPTVFAARQIINHGHVMLNGKRCNIASALLRPGDEIALKEKAKNIFRPFWKPSVRQSVMFRNMSKRTITNSPQNSSASRASTKCPIRCRWNRTWWSNITRADPRARDIPKGGHMAALFVWCFLTEP